MEILFFKEFLMISSVETISFLVLLVAISYFLHKLPREKFSFSYRVVIAMVFGLILGFGIQIVADFPTNPMQETFVSEVTLWYSLLGNGFISLIRMLVIPLVVVTILHVIINMQEDTNLSKLIKNGIFISMTMVIIAAIIGFAFGNLFEVGKIANSVVVSEQNNIREINNIVNTFKNLIPNNPVQAMTTLNIVGIVIFSAIIGIATRRASKKYGDITKPFCSFIESSHKIVISAVILVIKWMPLAVVPLLANTIAQRGVDAVLSVGEFILVLYISIAVMFAIQMLALFLFGLNPITFIKKALPVMILAFTSRSSVGCLPVTISTLTQKLGVRQSTASFLASFGTTGGMQGCAGVFPALAIVFVMNMSGQALDFSMVIMSVIVIAIGSIGIAGVPGTATIAASVSLSGTGLSHLFPLVNPILAIDPLIDMPRTMLNVTGSMTNAIMTDIAIKSFDEEVYNDLALNSKDGNFIDNF